MHGGLIILNIISQLSLGVYSWLIKTVPTNLSTQLLARMSIFSILSVGASLVSGHPFVPELSHLLTMGPLNTLHIAASYYAYKELPTTVSIPLFYIYPFINVFLASVLLNAEINLWTLPFLFLSFIGVFLLVFQPTMTNNLLGFVAIFIAAITESLIYISFKSKYNKNFYEGLFHLYFGSFIVILLARAVNIIEPFDFKTEVWKSISFYITFVGFIAFAILTYSIPYMPPELYASLAFFGVLSGYIFGHLGSEATPSSITIIGSALIVISASAVSYLTLS
jgi:drug/metabolite transporter (DMT)-like permease